jgi:hypothetical protein
LRGTLLPENDSGRIMRAHLRRHPVCSAAFLCPDVYALLVRPIAGNRIASLLFCLLRMSLSACSRLFGSGLHACRSSGLSAVGCRADPARHCPRQRSTPPFTLVPHAFQAICRRHGFRWIIFFTSFAK